MKLWIDDVREPPEGYYLAKSVNEAKEIIEFCENPNRFPSYVGIARDWEPIKIEIIDIDHDAGDYAFDGGDYIKLLDWLEETNRNYPIRIHSMNPVGRENMRTIIRKNGWTEVM
jgi:hypothetical protein